MRYLAVANRYPAMPKASSAKTKDVISSDMHHYSLRVQKIIEPLRRDCAKCNRSLFFYQRTFLDTARDYEAGACGTSLDASMNKQAIAPKITRMLPV